MRSSSSDGERSVMTAILMSTDTYMRSSSSDGERSVMTAILMSTDTYMSNSQKVAIFFIPFLIDYLQIYVIDVHS